jgi:CDP-2,3-bis-(O-geranylgeranyl)-sn-glycerol synthase
MFLSEGVSRGYGGSKMTQDLLFVLWFFLPAGLANAAPILAARLPWLNTCSFPLDCYMTFHNTRILGSHKTVRGLLSGIVAGILVTWLQVLCYEQFPLVRALIPLNYSAINPLLFGFLAAGGALIGDAIKSFFKRQRGITPGKTWFPFDQLDYILGGIAFTSLYIQLTITQYLLLGLVWFLLHPLATLIGYELKLKESPI